MKNRFKDEVERENEYKEFKDGICSIFLVVAIVIVVLQFSGILF